MRGIETQNINEGILVVHRRVLLDFLVGEGSASQTETHAILIKTNSLGEMQCSKEFKHYPYSSFRGAKATPDSVFILAALSIPCLK